MLRGENKAFPPLTIPGFFSLTSEKSIYLSQLNFRFLASHLTSILERSSLEKARNRTNYSCTFSQSERPNLLQAERQKSKNPAARGIFFI